ncbi:MAG: YyaL domain-containing protein [Acidimicrobiales bacterium]
MLTEWNAMAISSLAYAGRAFGRPEWVEAAAETAALLMGELRRDDGRWLRSWHPGSAATRRHLAVCSDYAWLVDAFTRLGEATGEAKWTDAAGEAASGLAELFWDEADGGYFTSGTAAERLVARQKDVFDGAVPAASSVASLALARLGELTGEPRFGSLAASALDLAGPALQKSPGALCSLALVADYLSSPRREVVVASCDPSFVRPAWERYLPDTVLAWCQPYGSPDARSPLWEGRDGQSAAGLAFVCEAYQCRLPVGSPDELGLLLDGR